MQGRVWEGQLRAWPPRRTPQRLAAPGLGDDEMWGACVQHTQLGMHTHRAVRRSADEMGEGGARDQV